MSIVALIENRVVDLNGIKVMVDSDVAYVYGVSTKRVNEAVRNNPEKFPDGYILPLSSTEKAELVENFDRFNSLKHSTVTPKVFTEKGLYMLATILKSPVAAQTTIAIIETFAQIRELSRNIQQISDATEGHIQQPLLQRGEQLITEILDDHLKISETESSVEINFAVLKFKHTVKRGGGEKSLNVKG